MPKNKTQDAPEEGAEIEQPQDAPVGYELLDPRTANVAHGGVIYPVTNGRIDCPPEIARELIAAGVLKG